MLTKYSTKEPVISKKDEQKSASPLPPDHSEPIPVEKEGVIIIEPTQFLSNLNFRTFWRYRELIYFLALRDIKIRYKQTLIGVAWVLLQPIITTLIFTTIFLRLGQSQSEDIPYPLFAFSGFTLWMFVNSAISNSSNSLINHSNLITKVYFPRLIIPVSAVGATLLDLFIGLCSLLVAMLIYGVRFHWEILFVFVLMIPVLTLSLGLGIILAALNVKYRDIKYILPFALQIFFFVSPVFYSLSILPPDALWLWKLNPMSGILENFRAALFGLSFDFYSLSISFGISLGIFFLAVYVFHHMEDSFADVI